MAKLIGIHNDLYCRRIVHAIQQVGQFAVQLDIPARNAINLRQRDLTAAFITPIDYAKDSSDYVILRKVLLHSTGITDTITLHFRDGLRDVGTIAIDPSSSAEIVLARIILAEEFEIEPKFVPAVGTLHEKLQKADAALLIGDASLHAAHRHENRLDLVDAWFDMTGLPYVHGCWCFREGELTDEEIVLLQESTSSPGEALAGTPLPEGISPEQAEEYMEKFDVNSTNEALYGLQEFLRFAYFHGVIPDVPEVTLHPPSLLDDIPGTDISPN
ncbi:MAG: MqnA/MqnD/SBP family protein [Bacteroidota bacterium]